MNWFDILKVDIDFDKEIDAMGQYGEGVEIKDRSEFNRLINRVMNNMMMGRSTDIKDLIEENIKQVVQFVLRDKYIETVLVVLHHQLVGHRRVEHRHQ